MTSGMLCMLLWLVTKLRPDMSTGKLGVKTYRATLQLCLNARGRVLTMMGEQKYRTMLYEVMHAVEQGGLPEVAHSYGFKAEWLSTKRGKGKGGGAEPTVASLEPQPKTARRQQAGIDRDDRGTASASTAGGSLTTAALAPAQGNHLDPAGHNPLSESPDAERAMQPVAPPVAMPSSGPPAERQGVAVTAPVSATQRAQREVQPVEEARSAVVPATALAPAQGSLNAAAIALHPQPETPPAEPEEESVAGAGSAVVAATALAPARGRAQPATPPQPVSSEPEAPAALDRNLGGTPMAALDAGGADAGASSLSPNQLDAIAVSRAKAVAKRQARTKVGAERRASRTRETLVEDSQLPDSSPDEPLATAQGNAGSETPPGDASPARDEDPPICVICRAPMLVSEDRQALPCMHVFHARCIERYASCKGLPIEQCCAFKCNVLSVQLELDDPEEEPVVERTNSPDPVQAAVAAVDAAAREVD